MIVFSLGTILTPNLFEVIFFVIYYMTIEETIHMLF